MSALRSERDGAMAAAQMAAQETKRLKAASEEAAAMLVAAEKRCVRLEREVRDLEDEAELLKLDLEAAVLEKEEAEELLDEAKQLPQPEILTSEEDPAKLTRALVALKELSATEVGAWRERCLAAEAAGAALSVAAEAGAKAVLENDELKEQVADDRATRGLVEHLSMQLGDAQDKEGRLRSALRDAEDALQVSDELVELLEAAFGDHVHETQRWKDLFVDAEDKCTRFNAAYASIADDCDRLRLVTAEAKEAEHLALNASQRAIDEKDATLRAWASAQSRSGSSSGGSSDKATRGALDFVVTTLAAVSEEDTEALASDARAGLTVVAALRTFAKGQTSTDEVQRAVVTFAPVPKSSLNFYPPRLNFLFSDSLCRRSKLIILVQTKNFYFFLDFFYIF